MTKKKFIIEDFTVPEPSADKDYCYNFNAGKTLDNCLGIKEAKFKYGNTNKSMTTPTFVNKMLGLSFFSTYVPASKTTAHRITLYGDDTKFYMHQMFSGTYMFLNLYQLKFDNVPVCLSYRYNDQDATIIASADKMVVWKQNVTPYALEDAPIVTSMCVNEGILFATLLAPAYKIWYNKDLNLENIGKESEISGYISLDDDYGYARKVVSFDEHVYIFRDYGISKISIYKDEIVVSEVYKSNTRMLSNTISVCGNVILFTNAEGVYTFDGVRVQKSKLKINKIVESLDNAVATSLGETYYLALKANFNDNKTIFCEEDECLNNALVIINANNFNYQIIRGVDILNFLSLKAENMEKVLVIYNTGFVRTIGEVVKESYYYDNVLPKYWRKKDVFEDNTSKLITKLTVYCDENVTFTLTADDVPITFVSKNSGLNEFYFKRQCNKLQLEISSNQASSRVERIEIDYYDCWHTIA